MYLTVVAPRLGAPVGLLSLNPPTSEAIKVVNVARTKDPRGINHTVAQRLQALALTKYRVNKKVAAAIAGLSTANNGLSVQRLIDKARERGFNPTVSTVLKEEYINDTF